MDKRQFGILKELMDAPIANTPHTCENCKWWSHSPLTETSTVCDNDKVRKYATDWVFTPPNDFGCNQWERNE